VAAVLVVVAAILPAPATAAGAAITHPYTGNSFGPAGAAAAGEFELPGAIGKDQSSGDVYVADLGANTLFKFDGEGEPMDFTALASSEIGGFTFHANEPGVSQIAVDSSSHDFYVVENAPVNSVKVFHASGEPGEFSALASSQITGFGEACGVTVDSEGDVYVGDYTKGVSIYAPSGELLTSIARPEACNLAVDSLGSVYVNRWQGPVEKFTASTFPVTPTTAYSAAGTVDAGPAFGIAVDPFSDDVYVDLGSKVVQRDSSGTRLGESAALGEGAVTESQGVAIDASTNRLYVSDGGSGRVKIYGAGELQKATIESESVAEVGVSEATLQAQINPQGSDTTYHFEYGTEPCSTGLCTQTPETELGSGFENLAASAHVGGLSPGTSYFFRVVASSEAGTVPGPDRTFVTFDSGVLALPPLPDGRAYERVSPAEKNGAEVGVPTNAGGLVDIGFVTPQQAALDGQAVTYTSFTAFGDAESSPAASQYLSRRTSTGWVTENITPPGRDFKLIDPVRGFTPDLGFAAVARAEPPLAPGAVSGFENLYLRNNGDGSLQALTTEVPRSGEPDNFCVRYAGASAGAAHVIFSATAAISPEAPEKEGEYQALYDWSATAGLKLVSVLPGGALAEPSGSVGFGSGAAAFCNVGTTVMRHAISEDGARIFWTDGAHLFARLNGTETVELDEPQGGPGPAGGGVFRAASADGSRVFFTDPHQLTADGGEVDLYAYNVDAETLTDLTPGGGQVQGVLGASEDGSYVYFAAKAKLTGEETNSAGQQAQAGQPNVYVFHDGEPLRFVATLSNVDRFDWLASPNEQTARVSPDGTHLAFLSTSSLTGYDNLIVGGGSSCGLMADNSIAGPNCNEAFIYSAQSNELACVSCNPSGARPSGPAVLPVWTSPYEQPRNLTDSGRLFFESFDGLSLRDTNGKRDVYEFESEGLGSCDATSPTFSAASGGCLYPISTGVSDDESYFVDASSDGDNVFFSTRQQLLSIDEDDRYDVYDARVGGGFPAPPSGLPPCDGEGCRPAAPPPAAVPSASSTFAGPGNPKPKKCAKKQQRKRKGRCRRHRRRHGRHHAHRRAQRSANREKGADR
jgi:hypothetical protein